MSKEFAEYIAELGLHVEGKTNSDSKIRGKGRLGFVLVVVQCDLDGRVQNYGVMSDTNDEFSIAAVLKAALKQVENNDGIEEIRKQ